MKSCLKTLAAVLVSGASLLGLAPTAGARSSAEPVKIGVVTDLSGVNRDYGGPTAVAAAEMAAEDFGKTVLGRPIQILSLDHQNKPDIAAQVVRKWFDEDGVGMVTELLNSAVALAVSKVADEKKRIAMVVGAATTRLTNEDCGPFIVHYAFDTYGLSHGTGGALVKRGGRSWFFITADLSFGHNLEAETTEVVKAAGGQVKGAVRHPAFQGVDFSSYILQAQNSKADVVALANSSNDTVNAVKMASEFGVTPSQQLAALLMQISDVHGLTLPVAQGLVFTDAWYWDLNDETRAFAKRFYARTGRMPGTVQAGTYSTTLQYLKAIQAAGTDDSDAVMKRLHATTIDDVFAKGGKIRSDGRMAHDLYLVQVKTPAQSKLPWDYYNVLETLPADQVTLPLSASTCSLARQ